MTAYHIARVDAMKRENELVVRIDGVGRVAIDVGHVDVVNLDWETCESESHKTSLPSQAKE